MPWTWADYNVCVTQPSGQHIASYLVRLSGTIRTQLDRRRMSTVGNARGTKVLQFHRSAARPQAIKSIEHNGFAADIFHNRNLRPPTWHFILTRMDNDEILYWGQESSMERAEDAARGMLNTLATAEAIAG